MDRAGGGDGKNRGKRTPAGRQPPHATWISNPYARNNRVSKCTWHVTTLPLCQWQNYGDPRVNLIRHRGGFRDSFDRPNSSTRPTPRDKVLVSVIDGRRLGRDRRGSCRIFFLPSRERGTHGMGKGGRRRRSARDRRLGICSGSASRHSRNERKWMDGIGGKGRGGK